LRDLPSAVLFCCTWNAVRSPMAAALLRHFHGRWIFVDSVGVREGELDPFAVAVMDEIGIDMSKHHPRTFDELEDESFDLVVSLSPEAQHSAVELTRTSHCDVEYWPTMDPTVYEGSRDARLEAYRDLRDGLMRRILQRFPMHAAPQA
jgi:protein-tyrosine-phosphatase